MIINRRNITSALLSGAALGLILAASHLNVLAQASAAPVASMNAPNSEGTMEGVNLQRTGVYRTKGVHQLNGLLWKSAKLFEINYAADLVPAFDGSLISVGLGFSEPILANGLIYFQLTTGQNLYYIGALDSHTGRGVWTFKVKDGLSAPAIAGDSLYVVAGDGNVYALNPQTGTEKWRFNSKDQKWDTTSSPAVLDGVIYFTSLSGDLYAVDVATKQAKWVFKAKGWLNSPSFSNDAVYIGGEKGILYAVDIKTGQEKWSFKAKGRLGVPMIANGMSYFRTGDGNLYGVDVKTGQQKWMTEIGGKVRPVFPVRSVQVGTALAFDNGTIFFAGTEKGSDYLFAIDAQSGQPKWKFKVAAPCRSPIIADGVIYLGSLGHLYAVDAKAGTQKWVLETKGEYKGKSVKNVASSPALVNGTAYFVTDEGFFYAMR